MLTDSDGMTGKICMVTGATDGIGKATAMALAQMGATVVVAGRSEQKCVATVEQIVQKTGNQQVEHMLSDFSVLAEVRQLAADFVRRNDRLDVLVNNAGAMFLRRSLSPEGYEMTFAVNHLAPFLLTHLLLDIIKASAPARIVNVASGGHRRKVLDFDDLQSRKGYSPMRVYGKSKLANMLFTYELAHRLKGTSVTVNAMHPGFVRTNMGANNGWFVRLMLPLIHIASLTPEQGARTAVYLASSPEVESVSGKYFINCAPARSSRASHDKEAAAQLWQASAEMVGLSE
ncbi:MAG: SDR family oxidoreductase [Anaerolineales bacterium]|jgi:NAD(P)-dependent dehydrogenase (short-subunit alcohol dehydrogenase family)